MPDCTTPGESRWSELDAGTGCRNWVPELGASGRGEWQHRQCAHPTGEHSDCTAKGDPTQHRQPAGKPHRGGEATRHQQVHPNGQHRRTGQSGRQHPHRDPDDQGAETGEPQTAGPGHGFMAGPPLLDPGPVDRPGIVTVTVIGFGVGYQEGAAGEDGACVGEDGAGVGEDGRVVDVVAGVGRGFPTGDVRRRVTGRARAWPRRKRDDRAGTLAGPLWRVRVAGRQRPGNGRGFGLVGHFSPLRVTGVARRSRLPDENGPRVPHLHVAARRAHLVRHNGGREAAERLQPPEDNATAARPDADPGVAGQSASAAKAIAAAVATFNESTPAAIGMRALTFAARSAAGVRPGPSEPSRNATRPAGPASRSVTSPLGVNAMVRNPLSRNRFIAAPGQPGSTANGTPSTVPMETRTLRRYSGSAHPSASRMAPMPKAAALRNKAPRFSWSPTPSSTATVRSESSRFAAGGNPTRSAVASTPRLRWKPTTSAIISAVTT